MCGIFGIVGEYDAQKARAAFAKLSHRGKDNCTIFENKYLFFAHNRLSIQDTKAHAHQPFQKDNVLLSFNGEIYNFKDLRSQLASGFNFQTDSDTEVILAAYLKWGIDFVQYLQGMFAIAIVDNDRLYIFRDRFGEKPLFYMQQSNFIFASEIKALTPFLTKNELNDDALLSYLSFLAPTPSHTFYKKIHKLAAGEYIEYHNNRLTIKEYYNPLNTKSNIITSEDEAISTLEEILEDSIKLRLNVDVPMASLLSGGIDSATINYFAKKHNQPLQTYTLGYEGYAKYDETNNAKESAAVLGIPNTKVIISQNDFLGVLDDVLYSLDEPLNDPASIPLYLLFQNIAQDGYKVVLSGEGSDELFLGYRQYFEFLDIEQAKNLKHKNWLKNYFKANYSQNREWEYYKRVFNDTLLFRTSGESFTDLQKNNLMKRNVKDNHSLTYLRKYREKFESSIHTDESIWYSYIDLQLFQAEHFLTKLDRVSMAHTIEARAPFLDHTLVDTIFSITPKLRYQDGITKSLLKKIMLPNLKENIIKRKKKGFSNPYMEYLTNSNQLQIIIDVNKKTGFFKDKELEELVSNVKNGSFKQHVWGLFVLSKWLDKNIL